MAFKKSEHRQKIEGTKTKTLSSENITCLEKRPPTMPNSAIDTPTPYQSICHLDQAGAPATSTAVPCHTLARTIKTVIYSPVNLVRRLINRTPAPAPSGNLQITASELAGILADVNAVHRATEQAPIALQRSNKNTSQKKEILLGLLALGAGAGGGGLMVRAWRNAASDRAADLDLPFLPTPQRTALPTAAIDTDRQTMGARGRRMEDPCKTQNLHEKCVEAQRNAQRQGIHINLMMANMESIYCPCPPESLKISTD